MVACCWRMTAFNYWILLLSLRTRVWLWVSVRASRGRGKRQCCLSMERMVIQTSQSRNSSMKHIHHFQLIQPAAPPPQNQNSPTPPTSLRNIFLGTPQKMNESELQQVRNYDMVGVRELKAYRNRAKKRTKVSARDRDQLPTDRSLSRDSRKKSRPDPQLLNKEEVIDCLPKLTRELSTQQLTQMNKSSWIDAFSPNLNVQNTTNSNISKITQQQKIFREFSLIRIRQKYEEHIHEWKRVLHTHKEGEKYPTLGDSIVAFRQKREEAEGTGISEDLVNLKSSYWGNTLRKPTGINDVCFPRREVHTLHEGVKAKGNSKLISETAWLQGKDEQGYRFKNCPQITVPSNHPKTSLR